MIRGDGLSLEGALALARRDVEAAFAGQLSLSVPSSGGWAATQPRWIGGDSAARALETSLRTRGFGVLRLSGPDGWRFAVNLTACPEGATPEEREALAIGCTRIEEIVLSRSGSSADRAAEAAERERALCMDQTVVTLRERLVSAQRVLETDYGDGSDEGRADRRSMTEALADRAAAITREVAARDVARGERYRYAPEIEARARAAARGERRACEGLDLDRLRERARSASLRAPEPPVVRAAASLFLLAASRGLELAALALPHDEATAAERARLLRLAVAARAAYASTHGAHPPEALWIARARPRATAWLPDGAATAESPAEHATADGERTACGLAVARLERIPEDHGRTDCARCGELLACGRGTQLLSAISR